MQPVELGPLVHAEVRLTTRSRSRRRAGHASPAPGEGSYGVLRAEPILGAPGLYRMKPTAGHNQK